MPYVVRKALLHVNFNLKEQTLSFLSNKSLYGQKYVRGYKRLLFATAILTYVFFWLLSEFYDLGERTFFMRLIDYSFAFITLLAFVPHNMMPYSLKHLRSTLQRLLHNILAGVVFLALPTLIVLFQLSIMPGIQFLGISGLTLIAGVVLVTLTSIILNGLNGITELFFINGVSIWSIFVTMDTFIRST
jgi:Zn-dependent membrane protease YugP